ncbi:MAG: carboxylase, partial [Candidatus Krumholzibacteria bacterium]|nr:carboxylase [Candidatus Krumholzibacteria bacterium]
IGEVYAELPRTRRELGYPPLVTPTSQIVGIQAVQNVLFGRYKMISGQVKDYAYGLYGTPPVPIDPKVQKLALKGYPRGEKPITCRAADMLEPEMEKAREAVKGLARGERDVLIYALYPTTGLRFLRWKYGLEQPPAEVKPVTLEEVARQEELAAKVLSGEAIVSARSEAPPKGRGLRQFNVFVGDDYYSIEVEEVGGRPHTQSAGTTAPIVCRDSGNSGSGGGKNGNSGNGRESKGAAAEAAARKNGSSPGGCSEFTLTAPMPGMVISYEVGEGDPVKEGDVLVVLEAMKMQNSLTSSVSGVISSIKVPPGTSVEKNQVILTISN